MLDFIKKNKIVVGAAALVVVMILAIIVVFILARNSDTEVENQDPFGDTGTERQQASSTDSDFLFGTSSERFVPDGAVGSPVPEFRAVTKIPIAGAVVYEREQGGAVAEYIRFTSRINGHVFDTPLATMGDEVNVSSKTILRIGNAKWSRNGSSTISRYFDEGGTQMFAYINYAVYGTSTGGVPPVEFTGRPMVETIQDVALSPQGNELFYLVTNKEGSIGYIENVITGARVQIWKSLLRNLIVSWETQNRILVYSNPSSYAEGAVWSINPTTKSTSIVLANNIALAAKTNTSGTKILYSLEEEGNTIFSLRVLDLGTGEITHLPLATLVEKCSWGPVSKYVYCAIPREEIHGKFLEDWYMGLTSTDDVLWRLDTGTGVVKKLFDPVEATEEKFDIVDIVVSPQEEYILFKTRVNNVLWALKLPEKHTTPSTEIPETEEE